jgi:prevent-host-death family protein
MVKSVEGIYRNGKVELVDPLPEAEGSRVIVTWSHPAEPVDLRERGIDQPHGFHASRLFSMLGGRRACRHECRHGTQECVRHVGAHLVSALALPDAVAHQLYRSDNWNEEIAMRTGKNDTIVVSALSARTSFGALLRRVEDEHRSLVIEKRGMPKAALLSIRDYVRLAAPEPEVLKAIGEESRRKGMDKLTSRQIDQLIKAARARKPGRG